MLKMKQIAKEALIDIHIQPIYSRKLKSTDKQETINFFKDFSSSMTPLDTNMTMPAQLPNPHMFLLYGISAHVGYYAGVTLADKEKFYESTYFKLKIGSRERFQAPMHLVPDLGGLLGSASTTATATTIQNYTNGNPSQTNFLRVAPVDDPIVIETQEEFFLEQVTNAAADFATNFYVTWYLHGFYGKSR